MPVLYLVIPCYNEEAVLPLSLIHIWDKQKFIRFAMLGAGGITVLYAAFFIALGKTQSEDPHLSIIPYSLNGGSDIDLPDTENCRIDVYDGMDNQAMFWQIPTIQAVSYTHLPAKAGKDGLEPLY